jgi:hypothetical protein
LVASVIAAGLLSAPVAQAESKHSGGGGAAGATASKGGGGGKSGGSKGGFDFGGIAGSVGGLFGLQVPGKSGGGKGSK